MTGTKCDKANMNQASATVGSITSLQHEGIAEQYLVVLTSRNIGS